jgi:hypothetical protein
MKGFLGLGLITLALLLGAAAHSAAAPVLEFDHLWIMVTQNAPERSALERAGFLISPDLNRHDGLGTASVTVEFENSYLELLWLDPTVPISPGLERAVEKFRQRTLWRTSGWCPIAIGFRRTASSSEALDRGVDAEGYSDGDAHASG